MNRILLGVGLAVMMLFASYAAYAQDGRNQPTVQAGEYRDLNALRWLKIGTAPLVNPALASSSRIAYKYQPAQVSEQTKAEIQKLAKEGVVAVGQKVGDEIVVPVDQSEAFFKEGASPSNVYVTTEPVSGLGKAEKIITWDAQGDIKVQ
jgi:hypothetical protein